MRKTKVKKPWVGRIIEFSTAHITAQDNERLQTLNNSWLADLFVVDKKEHGFLVARSRDFTSKEDIERIKKRGLSNAFISILKEAEQWNCDWVLIDRDVEIYPELKTYSW